MPITTEFVELFSFYMKRANFSDTTLADTIGIVRQTIYRWKQPGSKFMPRRSIILQCARVLGLSEEECNKLLTAAELELLNNGEYYRIEINTPIYSDSSFSPFIIGMPVPIPKFFGRHYELKLITEIWSQQPVQNVFITGKRMAGKTSFLHYLHHIKQIDQDYIKQSNRLFQSIPTALVDFQDIRMQKQSNVLAHILKELRLPLPEEGAVDLYWFMDTIEQLTKPAVILLDEIEAGIQASGLTVAFWNSLRSLSQRFHPNKISFIIASSFSPLALMEMSEQADRSSPFFNTFGHIITLGPWNKQESTLCINSSTQSFSKEEQEWIIKHSRNWPIIVQLLCDLCFKAKQHQLENWQKLALQRLAGYHDLLNGE